MARGCPGWRIGVAALAGCSIFFARDGRACSCIGGVRLEWPLGDSVDVALDTPVVVGGEVNESMFGEVPDIGADAGTASVLNLVSANGEQVGLARKQVLPTTACTHAFHFASPRALLSANTRYELRQGSTVLAAFTTGAQRRDTQGEQLAAERLSFEVLGTSSDPTQITTAFVTQLEQLPLYLNFIGSDEETTLPLRRVSSESVQLNFGSLVCPEVRVLGADGVPLVSRSLCDAERCLHSDGTVVQSSCGGNYAVDIDYARFRALPLGCPGDVEGTNEIDAGHDDVATEVSSGDGDSATGLGQSDPPDASKVEPDSSIDRDEPQKVAVRHTDRGCTTHGVPGNGGGLFALTAIVAVWLRRRYLGRAYSQTIGTPS